VTELLREEVLAREAREMGLDEGDTIVRRRLAQKLQFMVQDTVRLAEPTEEDLRRFYEANRAGFEGAARVSFTQIYFSPQRRKDAARDATDALARLSGTRPIDAAALGDPSALEAALEDADQQTVASIFGPQFASAVLQLKPESWHGPIASAYGMHLVADPGGGSLAYDDSQCSAGQDADREPHAAGPDADPDRHRIALRDHPGAAALRPRQAPGIAFGSSPYSTGLGACAVHRGPQRWTSRFPHM